MMYQVFRYAYMGHNILYIRKKWGRHIVPAPFLLALFNK